MDNTRQTHNIEPIFDSKSKILILGSFPSVKSREGMFFYNHPQNRFWKVLSAVLNQETPQTIEEKKIFLLKNKIALWDVIASCTISGSSDSSIKDVETNDINMILNHCDIKMIFCNGNLAYSLFMKHLFPILQIEPIMLPSTSPANARYTLEKLCDSWSQIIDYLN